MAYIREYVSHFCIWKTNRIPLFTYKIQQKISHIRARGSGIPHNPTKLRKRVLAVFYER